MSDDSKLVNQSEIEELLRQAKAGESSIPPVAAPPNPGYGDPSTPGIAHGDIEYLFNQAQQALASVDAPREPRPLAGIAPFRLEEFSGAAVSAEVATLELIRDVELDLKIELGRTQMYLEDVLKLRKGSVVPLDKLAGDPVDIYVNGRLIARGEVLVLNDNFCVRVVELIAAELAKAG
jgi:flagellar motor switch protein FliN/FliY